MKSAVKIVFGLSALALLASCGVTGGLQRPGPMWNADSARAAENARRDEAIAQRNERNARTGASTDVQPQIPEPASPPLTSPDPMVAPAAPPPATP